MLTGWFTGKRAVLWHGKHRERDTVTHSLSCFLAGFFGLFGLKKDEVSVVWLSILGLTFALASLVTSFFVKVTHAPKASPGSEGGFVVLPQNDNDLNHDDHLEAADTKVSVQEGEGSKLVEPPKSKVRGIIAALCAGFFFGINFDPPTYIQQHNCEDGRHNNDILIIVVACVTMNSK